MISCLRLHKISRHEVSYMRLTNRKIMHPFKHLGKYLGLSALMFAGTSLSFATQYDLSAAGTQSLTVTGKFGGDAIFSDYFAQPTGTGVFRPFLDLKAKGNGTTEQAYNTDGFTDLFLDQQRPQWNNLLQLSQLQTFDINSAT
jgi:hypothetical protein